MASRVPGWSAGCQAPRPLCPAPRRSRAHRPRTSPSAGAGPTGVSGWRERAGGTSRAARAWDARSCTRTGPLWGGHQACGDPLPRARGAREGVRGDGVREPCAGVGRSCGDVHQQARLRGVAGHRLMPVPAKGGRGGARGVRRTRVGSGGGQAVPVQGRCCCGAGAGRSAGAQRGAGRSACAQRGAAAVLAIPPAQKGRHAPRPWGGAGARCDGGAQRGAGAGTSD